MSVVLVVLPDIYIKKSMKYEATTRGSLLVYATTTATTVFLKVC